MPDVLLPVPLPFHSQETLYYCGPATLQMILSALGVAAPSAPPPPTWQDLLYEDVKNNTGATRPSGAPSTPTAPYFADQKCEWCEDAGWKCWSTTPGVLVYLLNKLQTAGVYSITMHTMDIPATGVLLDAIDAKLPGVALVFGWKHWLALDGYLQDEPGSTLVAGRNLNGVYLRDPLATAATHYVNWQKWKSDYLRPVPCGDYMTFIVVFQAVPAPPQTRTPPQAPPATPTNVRIDPLDVQRVTERFRRRHQKLLLKEEAMKLAEAAIAMFREKKGRLQVAFTGARAADALLVQRLDDRDRYYYICSFTNDKGETARVIVDAHDGTFEEVSGIQEHGHLLPPFVSSTAGLERIQAEAAKTADALRYHVRPGTVGTHPVLVWKPCGESSSPFLPFYEYSVGDSFVYYRVDGRRFDVLTSGPA